MTADRALGTHSDIDPDRVLVHRLVCSEVWGGNNIVDLTVEVPGFTGWFIPDRYIQQSPEATYITW